MSTTKKSDVRDACPAEPTDGDSKSGEGSFPERKLNLVLKKYNFNHERRGLCIIINNEHFNKTVTGQLDRDGTAVDASALESTFMQLGFDVTRHDDLTATDMSITLRQASKDDYSDCDCFALVILSHGDQGYLYGTDGKVSTDSIVKHFKGDTCPSLAGKPKLFFFQACQGRKYDWGVEVADTDETDAAQEESVNVRTIPIEADCFYAYSVVPGYFSWRNNVDGSWFVQALCQVFKEHWDSLELASLMQLVSHVVANEFASCTDDDFTTGMRQVPCMVSTLTKQVFFTPKY